MKILVIGGTGHIGRFLSPQLQQQGHEVIVVTRGKSPLPTGVDFGGIDLRTATYARDDESWAAFVAETQADTVIDITGNDVPGTYAAAKGHCKRFLACGSVWMFGVPKTVPTPEETQTPCPFEGYAQRYDELVATMEQAKSDGIAFTAIMPPNICGPGKIPLDGSGGRSLDCHRAHSRGEPIALPEGCNNLIGPCDAADIANAFALAVENSTAAAGQFFNVGSAYSLTAPQFVEALADIYGVQIPVRWVPFDRYYHEVLPELGANYHFRHHMQPSLAKISAALGYAPRFTAEQTLARAVQWMRQESLLD